MAQGKEFVLQQLGNALAVERAIVEHEELLTTQIGDPEIQQHLQQMATEDRGHVANFERVIEAMGAQPAPPDQATQHLLGALRQAVEGGREQVNRLAAHGLAKHKAVSAGRIFQGLAQMIGDPRAMQPLAVNLREDTRHERQLAESLVQLAQREAMADGGLDEVARALGVPEADTQGLGPGTSTEPS